MGPYRMTERGMEAIPNFHLRTDTNRSPQSTAKSIQNVAARAVQADVPLGMWAATAKVTSRTPTTEDVRNGSFDEDGWNQLVQRERRRSSATQIISDEQQPLNRRAHSGSMKSLYQMEASADNKRPASDLQRTPLPEPMAEKELSLRSFPAATKPSPSNENTKSEQYPPNSYTPPRKPPWKTALRVSLQRTTTFILTPTGFFITLYGLNVIAWGGMLFLLLCNASPAMCSTNTALNHFDGCNDIDSPRRKWLEIDSQILNALFCVTGFGLAPWRFRELYWLLRWRIAALRRRGGAVRGLRVLAGIHRGWFRLPGSQTLDEMSWGAYLVSIGREEVLVETEEEDERVPLPVAKRAADPVPGVRAPPTRLWLLDFVIWCNVFNTFMQAVLCGFMWGFNRYTRPSWATGLFIGLGCIVAGIGGIVMFKEGKDVKNIEGVAPEGWTESVMADVKRHTLPVAT